MTSLFKMEVGSFHALVGVLDKAGLTAELAEKVRHNPEMAKRMVATLRIPEDGHPYRGGQSNVERVGDTYHLFVDYQMPRDKETLEAEFSKDGVSKLFYGNHEWQLHSSCQGIDQTPCERDFFLKHFNHPIMSDKAIAEMDKLGYRPATHLEAYALAKRHPDLQRRFWFVALGSFILYGGFRHVAGLDGNSDRRTLRSPCFDNGWYSDCRFLFFRKASS